MCTYACVFFGVGALTEAEIRDKEIIEVGSQIINGSLRPYYELAEPARYLGVDMLPGLGVDEICRAEDLVKVYGENSFDLVVSTEMLEHVQHWQEVIYNLKAVCRPGGKLVLTTRSKGYPYHGYPNDFWRFEVEDMAYIFQDWEIERLEADPSDPGVFIKARKITAGLPPDLENYPLYNISLNAMATKISYTQFREALLQKQAVLIQHGLLKETQNDPGHKL